ncbi:antibiotic biosynthesis monooxygenase family protein [Spirosoma soli]|uniref:Antibiotic biosynthesis monooxygenase family protein n=1 Tax=Spirosoma soli TaxID=1770529 RepID=A0ABW5M7Z1_9BACT
MFARVVRVSLSTDTAAEAINYFRDTVTPALQQHPGFAYSRCLYAPSDHHCLMVSAWESEEARTGAETSGLLNDVLKHLRSYFDGKPTVEYYEIAV